MSPFRLTPFVAPEDELHAALAAALWRLLPADAVWTTWEARNAASVAEGARRKRLGLLPGWPDVGVFYDGRCALLELKRVGGQLSAAQRELHPRLAEAGFPVAVAKRVTDALDAISDAKIPLRGRVMA